jgi:phage virion morphogenesis protein
MKITTTITDSEVKASLQKLQGRFGNLKSALNEVGQRYERRLLEGWARGETPDGTPWQPLSAITLQLQLHKGKGFKKTGYLTAAGRKYLQSKSLLVQSGRMRKRLHYQADATAMTIGISGIPYAAIHQFGGMAGRGRKVKIPARPWLAVNSGTSLALAEQDKQMVLEVIGRYLAG